jgi:hypothetical protein
LVLTVPSAAILEKNLLISGVEAVKAQVRDLAR